MHAGASRLNVILVGNSRVPRRRHRRQHRFRGGALWRPPRRAHRTLHPRDRPLHAQNSTVRDAVPTRRASTQRGLRQGKAKVRKDAERSAANQNGCERFDAQLADCRIDRRGATMVTRTTPPLLVRSGHRTCVTGIGVKQPRAPGCAETSRLHRSGSSSAYSAPMQHADATGGSAGLGFGEAQGSVNSEIRLVAASLGRHSRVSWRSLRQTSTRGTRARSGSTACNVLASGRRLRRLADGREARTARPWVRGSMAGATRGRHRGRA
jgi:hypothetical protein